MSEANSGLPRGGDFERMAKEEVSEPETLREGSLLVVSSYGPTSS